METINSGSYLDIKSNPIKNDNKNKILTVAINLFAKNGYNGVSIRDITKEVGIKESSLYNHFGSKEAILETIFHNFRIETSKIMVPENQLDDLLMNMSLLDFLKQGLLNFQGHISDSTMEKVWIIVLLERYRNSIARSIYLEDIQNRTINFLEIVFKKSIELNNVKALDPKLLAIEYQLPIFSMVEIYIMLRIDGSDTEGIQSKMIEHLYFFVNQITK
jgi:AcrR family transcriptional regulator